MRIEQFELTATALLERGYSPLPIAAGEKYPGRVESDGRWLPASGWQKWCREQPSHHMLAAWMRMLRNTNDVSIGVACGRALICIDIDQEEIVAPLMAILPVAYVQKKGRKGVSLFYTGNTEVIRSKNYRTPDRVGLVDLLAEGKQTVLPPSIHPDTGKPYVWMSDETLLDVGAAALTLLPDNVGDFIGEVLRDFGYDPEGDRDIVERMSSRQPTTGTRSYDGIFSRLNTEALASLDRWVPALALYKCRSKPGGYEAVADWRDSSSGRSLDLRKRSLSIHRSGITDFGSGDTYTPIDLVMAARCIGRPVEAFDWLAGQLPQEPPLQFS